MAVEVGSVPHELRFRGIVGDGAGNDTVIYAVAYDIIGDRLFNGCLGVLLEIWTPDNHRVGDRYQGAGVFTRLHHIGVVTADLEAARHLWCNVMGFRVDTLRTPTLKGGRLVESDGVRVLAIPLGTTAGESGGEIVAVLPEDQSSSSARFLQRYGGSANGTMHHMALATRDVRAAADFVRDRGLELVGPVDADFAWIHPRSAGGVLIQIVRESA